MHADDWITKVFYIHLNITLAHVFKSTIRILVILSMLEGYGEIDYPGLLFILFFISFNSTAEKLL